MISSSLETNRLLIRPFNTDDWTAVHAYLSDAQVTEWLPEGIMTVPQVQAFVAENAQEGDARTAYAVLRHTEGDLIGHIIFHPWFAPRTYEIGWAFHKAHHGRGYATEASLALMQYGFVSLHLHRIIATCQPQNTASYRVMEKLGMRREGHFLKCIYRPGDIWWDEYFYAMLEEEWFTQKEASTAHHSL